MSSDETKLRIVPPANGASSANVVIPGVLLGAVLGRGGMAVVYEGLDHGFTPPRRVAVKLMDPSLSADPDFRARFEREAAIVADFRHDNGCGEPHQRSGALVRRSVGRGWSD